MNKFLFSILLVLTSCKDARLKEYEKTIEEADSFSVYYRESNKVNTISNDEITAFKKALTRDVKPEPQKKFMYDVGVDIFKNRQKTAGLMITNNNTEPFVTYRSENLTFGFPLTYEIGMTIDNLNK